MIYCITFFTSALCVSFGEKPNCSSRKGVFNLKEKRGNRRQGELPNRRMEGGQKGRKMNRRKRRKGERER